MAHRPIGHNELTPVIAFANRIEFVGGPRDGQSEDRTDTPDALEIAQGLYRRSVRCAEDGAMRYVWQDSVLTRKQD